MWGVMGLSIGPIWGYRVDLLYKSSGHPSGPASM